MTRIYAFPNGRQLTLLRRHDIDDDRVILTHPDVPCGDAAGLVVVDVTSPAFAGLLANPSTRILCLNELAVYLLDREHPLGECGFTTTAIALTKTEMAAQFAECGLATSKARAFDLDDPTIEAPPYPFVVKPDFGFASQLVCRIDGPDAWSRYLGLARDEAAWPLRARYVREFFSDRPGLLRRFVFEPDLSASRFLSVPFLFDGSRATSFPVEGWHAATSPASSFAWRGFRAPARLAGLKTVDLDEWMARLAGRVGCRPGIYHVELLHDRATGPRFLEFSPRPTGGLVPELVHHAYGVDIDELAILAFLGRAPAVSRTPGATHVGVRRTADEAIPPAAGPVVSSTCRDSAGRQMIDEIIRLDPADTRARRSFDRSESD